MKRKPGGCCGANGGLFTRGVVKRWVWLHRCQRDRMSLWLMLLSSSSVYWEGVPTCSENRFMFLWACFWFSPSISEGTVRPLARPVIVNPSVRAAISPASLWDIQRVLSVNKLKHFKMSQWRSRFRGNCHILTSQNQELGQLEGSSLCHLYIVYPMLCSLLCF